jgi:LCP family protein required for cell wall assembly
MSDTSSTTDPAVAAPSADPATTDKRRRRRRIRRIVVISATALLTVICGGAVSAYVVADQLAANVHRIQGVFPKDGTAAGTAVLTAAKGSMTILLTGRDSVSAGGAGRKQQPSGLIAIVHLNAGRRSGAVVSIPPETVVPVPGHGKTQIENSLVLGGPALLIRTVQNLTGVRIDHYAVVDFQALINVVNALGGVNVILPGRTASYNGVSFRQGVNHLNGVAALAYVRQGSISEDQRVQRQQNLLRAILQKIGGQNLLGNPLRAYGIVHAFTRALSVDSNFSNRQLMSLATSARSFRPGSGTFVTVPVRPAGPLGGQGAASLVAGPSGKLWQAIKTGSVAAFARQNPATVTTVAPR